MADMSLLQGVRRGPHQPITNTRLACQHHCCSATWSLLL